MDQSPAGILQCTAAGTTPPCPFCIQDATCAHCCRGLGRWTQLPDWSSASGKQMPLPFLCAAGVLLAFLGIYFGAKSLHHRLVVQNVLQSGISDPPPRLVLDLQRHAADEMLLRQIVDECSKRQDTVMYVDASRKLVVSSEIDPK